MLKKIILIALGALLLVAGGIFLILKQRAPSQTAGTSEQTETDAIKAGKDLSNGNCSGTGPGVLTRSPMDSEDFSIIIPYGSVIGGHVTPIDHQYFSPKEYNSPRDAYEVYAMADSRLVDIGPRVKPQGTEYRLVFSMTCTFLYYYDLVTSLAPDIKAEYDKNKNSDGYATIDIQVKSGQLIGRIGGQTLDFAVWDTTKPLSGFINPKSYEGERWKIYTADPLDYYAPDLKELALSRYVRTAEPISGKIDYDIDGRLIGNWFREESGGYAGPGEGREGYWTGHLAFAPDHYDPSHFVISIGSLWGGAEDDTRMQHMTKTNAPDPKEVTIETGLVKYDLVGWSYLKADGSSWDRMSLTKGVVAKPASAPIFGCALAQMLESRKIKFEVFKGKSCSAVAGFTSAAKIYER